MDNFEQIESLFARLISIPDSELSESERAEISEFVDVGEYGVALHTSVWIYIEENKIPTELEVDIVKGLAELMKKDPEPMLQRLRSIGKD